MDFVRTPDERFAAISAFTYTPRYENIPAGDGTTLRLAYVDEGPRTSRAVVMLHGEPSWGFLYRKVMRACLEAGLRVVVPDLIGFGRSDKPTQREDYTYARHVTWLKAWLDAVSLEAPALLCQDWGGLIGLRIAGEEPHRFGKIIAANTFLPTGDVKPPPAFFAWREFSQTTPVLPISRIVRGACLRELPDEVAAAYDAPFPDETFKAGARQFPALVPTSPDNPACEANRAAWAALGRRTQPFVTAFGDGDPITAGADRVLQQHIPGAAGQPHVTLARAGHFLQEDVGEELGAHVARFVAL